MISTLYEVGLGAWVTSDVGSLVGLWDGAGVSSDNDGSLVGLWDGAGVSSDNDGSLVGLWDGAGVSSAGMKTSISYVVGVGA